MGGYSGGYGDNLTAEELIGRLEALNTLRSRECAHPGAEAEDLAQEGRIALWRAVQSHPGHSREYYSAASGRRIREAAIRQTWTGHTRHHGQPTDPLRQPGKRSLDDPDFAVPEAVDGTDWVNAAEWGYHRGEILAALNTLSPQAREYVWRRFWCGWSAGELDQVYGGNSWRVWDAARSELREMLALLG